MSTNATTTQSSQIECNGPRIRRGKKNLAQTAAISGKSEYVDDEADTERSNY